MQKIEEIECYCLQIWATSFYKNCCYTAKDALPLPNFRDLRKWIKPLILARDQ